MVALVVAPSPVSWHEMGLYDVPAMMDYILERTGFEEMHLLGHSMASSAMLVTLSERPEYNNKVRLASFMSPSIRMRGFIRWAFDAIFSRFRNSVDVRNLSFNVLSTTIGWNPAIARSIHT